MKLQRHARLIGAFCFALVLPQTALAQSGTPMGTITATINGAAYDGETLDVPSEGTATAEFRSFGPVLSLSVQGHDPEADSIMNNVLSVEISLMGNDASATIMETSVSWWPEGMSAPFYLSEDSGAVPEIMLDSLSLEEGNSSISGRFSAQLCRKDSFFAETDTADCIPVEGSFDTALRKAD